MNTIGLFYGIRVTIEYSADCLHRFVATYANHSCIVDILDGVVIQG